LITEEAQRGFALPLLVDILKMILDASLALLGCHKKDIINEDGVKVPKYRMMHDQTFC
jgi:hypothetical protein